MGKKFKPEDEDGMKWVDEIQAFEWAKRCVDDKQCHFSDKLILGEMYENGKGTRQDKSQAFTLYKQVIEDAMADQDGNYIPESCKIAYSNLVNLNKDGYGDWSKDKETEFFDKYEYLSR